MSAAGRAGFRLLRLDLAPAPMAPPPRTAGGGAASAPSAAAELLVPDDSPIFAGHFPGRPLLPGVAHLALLRQVLEALAARGVLGGEAPGNTVIAEVRRFRLRREIVPGARVELRVQGVGAVDAARAAGVAGAAGTARETAGGSGVFRFELRWLAAPGQPGEIASEGTVRTGIVSARPPAAAPIPRPDLALGGKLPPAMDLVPHAPPARLLAEVLAAGAGGILCAGNIPAHHPLAAGGEAPGFLAIELGAQAAAALEALARHPGGPPRLGYLVGVRDAHLPARLPTGRLLRVTAVPAGNAGALAIYDVEVAEEGAAQPLAAGAISTFLLEP
jgi:3-hydroxymyristoyl/3-hydroxydecanoyl-(acyl carrier protein) dehydratase/predicted hotdog family 3-hydroxylacyl-ACP dehydratase